MGCQWYCMILWFHENIGVGQVTGCSFDITLISPHEHSRCDLTLTSTRTTDSIVNGIVSAVSMLCHVSGTASMSITRSHLHIT